MKEWILEDVNDDAIIYVDEDDDNRILHIKTSITVTGDDVQNEVTLVCL